MATQKKTEIETATMNVWQKLLKIRQEFYQTGIKQSGVNEHAEFTYFELKDIVPVATELFVKYNCIFHCSFPDGKAVGEFINLDKTDEVITVEFDSASIAEPSKFRMNEVQALGAAITYMRRYLYLIMLDITVNDVLNSNEAYETTANSEVPKPKKAKPKKPVTTKEREEIKEELTAPEAKADELQINALKAALKKLKDLDPSQEEFIQKVALKTEGFTNLTKNLCEELIIGVAMMIDNYEKPKEDK